MCELYLGVRDGFPKKPVSAAISPDAEVHVYRSSPPIIEWNDLQVSVMVCPPPEVWSGYRIEAAAAWT